MRRAVNVVRLAATVLAVVIALMAVGTVSLWVRLTTLAPRADVAEVGSLAGAGAPVAGSLGWKIRRGQRVNVLLLARGGAGKDNPDYTDTILVLSIRPASGRAALVSLDRFIWADIPATVHGGVSGKLYSAFALGGQSENTSLRGQWRTATGSGDLAAATVAELIGQPIDAWVAIDIDAFHGVVDALGGIRVTVPERLDDPEYPVDESAGRTERVIFEPGPQSMDGERAVEYARSRLSTSESDRSRRQELVMSAILERLRGAGTGPALLPVLAALDSGMLTNLRLSDTRPLNDLLHRIRLAGIARLTVDETNLLRREPLPEGDYLLLPRDPTLRTLRRAVAAALP